MSGPARARTFIAFNRPVLAIDGPDVQWAPMADPSGPPVYATGILSRIEASNFFPVVRSTETPAESVGQVSITATGFGVPIEIDNIDLRTIQVGSAGSAGGTFTFVGTVL